MEGKSAAAVVPEVGGFAAAHGALMIEDAAQEEPEHLAAAVELHLAGGSFERVAVKDDDLLATLAGDHFQTLAELEFFGGKDLGIEPAHFAEGGGLDEDEGTGEPFLEAAGEVPELGDEVGDEHLFIERHGGAAGEDFAGGNLVCDIGEEGAGGMRVGIDEDEPVAGGGGGAGIAGAADLVEGFEDDVRAGGAGDLGGAVGGVVVADDELKFPAAVGEGGGGGQDLRKRGAEELFLVEGGDDDGDTHGEKIAANAGIATGASFLVVHFPVDDF